MFRAVLLSLLAALLASSAELPSFRSTDAVTGLKMGYQLVVADLNGDKRLDFIVVDERSTELAWYENPSWERHVLATDVPRVINLECADLDGGGTPEIAMAHFFETNPDRSQGRVLMLKAAADPRQPWTVTELDRVPTAHRVRWIPMSGHRLPWLLVAPLVGPKTYAPEYKGNAPIYAYKPGEWRRIEVSAELNGILHSIAPVEWSANGFQLLTASFDGISRFQPSDTGPWKRYEISKGNREPCPRCGSSEVKMGRLGDQRFLATIEPWHGDQVAVYLERPGGWERIVIQTGMVNGHALAVADLNGDGRDEIVSGFRGKGFHLTVHQAQDDTGKSWKANVIDEGGVAAADCKIADLTGDQRPDIICSGASTGNVRIFENLGSRH